MHPHPEVQLSVATTRPHLGHDHAEPETSLPQSGHFRNLAIAHNLPQATLTSEVGTYAKTLL